MNREFVLCCVVVLSCILALSSARVRQSGDAKNKLKVENHKSLIKTEPKTNSEVPVHMSEDGYTIVTIPKTSEKHNLIHSIMNMFRNASKVEHQALLVIAPEDEGNAGKMDQQAGFVIASEYEGNAIKADQTSSEYDVAKSSRGNSKLSYNDSTKNVTEDHDTAESGRVEMTSSVYDNVLVLNEDSPKDQDMLAILDNSVPFLPSAASETSNSNLQRTDIGSNDSPSSPIPELSNTTSDLGLEVSEASALTSSIESSPPVNREPAPNGPMVLSETSENSNINSNTKRTNLSLIPDLSRTTSDLGLDVSENQVLSSSIDPSSILQNREPVPNVPVVSSAASENSNINIKSTDIGSNDSTSTSIPEVPKKVSYLVFKISEAPAPSSSIDPSSTPQNRELNVETTTTTTTEPSSTKPSDINSDVTTSLPIREEDDVPSTSVSPNSRDSLARDLSPIRNSMEGPLNFKATNIILKGDEPSLEACRKSQQELIDIFNMGLEQLTSLFSAMYKKMSIVTSQVNE